MRIITYVVHMVPRKWMKIKQIGSVSKVQKFGQITITKEAMDILGVAKGDTIGFFEVQGSPGIVVIAKVSVVITPEPQGLTVD